MGSDNAQVFATVLECDINQATSIDDVVRRIEYSAAFQLIGHLQGSQLIIGRPRHGRTT
ncbi:hypothetical protein D3C79_1021830 [compost metagenome]